MPWHNSAGQDMRYLHTKLPRISCWVLDTSERGILVLERFGEGLVLQTEANLLKLFAIAMELQSSCVEGIEFFNTSIPMTGNMSLDK